MSIQETLIQKTIPAYVPTPGSTAQDQLFLHTGEGNSLYSKNSAGVSAPVTVTGSLSATAPLDFPNTLAQTSSDLTIPLVGAVLNDVIALGVPAVSVLPNTSYSAFVSAAGVVTVRFNNYSAAAANPTFGDFVVTRIRSEFL